MMELYPGGGNGRRVAPFLNSNSCQIGAGPQNQNAKGAVESDIEIQPEMYDFSSFLEGDIVDAVFPEFRDMLKAACLPRTGPVVPERVEEVSANKNMEHRVQIPPPPPPHPPQHLRPVIFSSTRASVSLKWTKELHACFVNAVRRLGGAFIATPKTVRDIMNVDGLGLHQVKSHLQIYRMGKRFCNDWKKFYERGPLFARALGAPSTPAPSSQPDGEKKRRGRPKKQDNGSLQSRRGRPKKHDNESLRMNIQFHKNLLSILEAQNQYVKVAVSRMAAYQTMGGYAYAANQNRGYPFAANQNRGYPFAANQNIGGQVFPLNQKMGGSALAGTRTYPENIFVRQSTTTPMPSRYPHQMNQYNSSISAAATHAGIWPARKPNELQCMPVPYSHPLTQGSFSGDAASGLYKQGFNFNPGKSSGTKVMSDEEFIESLLLHYDELIGKSG